MHLAVVKLHTYIHTIHTCIHTYTHASVAILEFLRVTFPPCAFAAGFVSLDFIISFKLPKGSGLLLFFTNHLKKELSLA